MQLQAGCVGTNLVEKAGMSVDELRALNASIRALHDKLTTADTEGPKTEGKG